MPGGMTSDNSYSAEYQERHIDRTNNNEVKVRLIHHVTTYNAGHSLYLDYFAVSSIEYTTAEDIADAVWDETLSEHTDVGSTGKALTDAGTAGNPWSALLVDNATPGTFGWFVGTKLLTLAKWLGLK